MIHIAGYQHLEELKTNNIIGIELTEYIKDLIWERYDLENNEDWYDVKELTEKRDNGTLEVDTEWFKIVLLEKTDNFLDLPPFDGFCGGSIYDVPPEQISRFKIDKKVYCHEIVINTDNTVDFIIPDCMADFIYRMN